MALVFNAANAPFVPMLRRRGIPTIVHVDGLEWKRAKWGRLGRRYYLASERLAVRVADALIADAQAIQDYYRETYERRARFIPYGAPVPDPAPLERLRELYGVDRRGYYLVVARMEPENHVLEMVRGYAGVQRGPATARGRQCAVRERVPAQVQEAAAATRGCGCWAASGTRRCSTRSTPTARLTSTATRSGGPTPPCCGPWVPGAPVVAVDVVFNREVLGEDGDLLQPASVLRERGPAPVLRKCGQVAEP